MRCRRSAGAVAALLLAGCALGAAPGPAPVQPARAFEPPPVYATWWARTERCAGRRSSLKAVRFYAVEAPRGYIYLAGQRARAWWVRDGNRIYLPAHLVFDEQLVRHEMLHAITDEARHSPRDFVRQCHLASLATWTDSTLRRDPENPRGL